MLFSSPRTPPQFSTHHHEALSALSLVLSPWCDPSLHSRVITAPPECTQGLCPVSSKGIPSYPILQLASHLSHQLNAQHLLPFTPSCLIFTSGITLPRKTMLGDKIFLISSLLQPQLSVLHLFASPPSHAPSRSPQGHTGTFPCTLRLKVTNNVLPPLSLSFQSSTQVTCSSRISPKAHRAKI